jgi:D-alanyl-D-alanine carboxypeptidase
MAVITRHTLCAAALASATFAAAPALAQSVDLSDAEIAARVQTVVDQAMARPEAVGLSVAVAKGDDIVVGEGVGMADLEFDVPANAETMFRIGSVTKQFTAAAVMKLVERGEIGLDDDLHMYLPDFDTGGRVVTIRQMLNHASGIPDYTANPEFMTKGSPLDLTDEELLGFIKDMPFDFEPGEGWKYSNTNYYLLGMVIEAVDGRPYPQFVQEELFTPLGLTRTQYGSEHNIIKNRAQGYRIDPATGVKANDADISMRTPGAAGALLSTASDLVRWQLALSEGRAVSPASFETMTTSTVATGQGDGQYGFGLMVSGEGDDQRIWHSGGINGFNSVLTWLPGQDLRVAVISNSEALPSQAVSDQIITALTSAEPPAPLRTTARPGAEEAVRRLVAELAAGEPNYDLLSPGLAAATRQQLPGLQQMFTAMGAVQSVDFVEVDLRGADVFDVRFENGATRWMINVDDDGVVQAAGVRPLGPPPGAAGEIGL